MPTKTIPFRSPAVLGAAVLLAYGAMVPWARAKKCDIPREERTYELVEIRAVDGGSVPEAVQAQWADGVILSGHYDGFGLYVPALDVELDMEREP